MKLEVHKATKVIFGEKSGPKMYLFDYVSNSYLYFWLKMSKNVLHMVDNEIKPFGYL